MVRRIRGLTGLIVLVALAVGLPWALAATVGNPLHAWSSLQAGDVTDRDVIAIMAAVAYVAWATFAVAVVVEAATMLAARISGTHRRQIRIPLLGIQQDLARTLITAALLLLPAVLTVVGPATSAFADNPSSPVATSSATPGPVTSAAPVSDVAAAPRTPDTVATAGSAAPVTYVIPDSGGLRSYWALAEHYLGDGQRWQEIWQLNQGHTQTDGSVMDSPRQLHRGWTVQLPAGVAADARSTTAPLAGHDVTVAAGDTMSGLATEHGVSDWHAVWDANAGRAEPGGEQLTDPDLLRPGWTVTIPDSADATPPTTPPATTPAPATPPPAAPAAPAGPMAPPTTGPATPAPTTSSPTTAPTSPAAPLPANTAPAPAPATAAAPAGHATTTAGPSAVVSVAEWAAVLTAGGGTLAGGTYLALRRYRRRQFRRRRPGRAISGPATRHVPLEQVLATSGAYAVRDVDFIDAALRTLSATVPTALPPVLAAALTEHHLDLLLADDGDRPAPAPWTTVEPGRWRINKDAELPEYAPDTRPPAPYPTLVSVGCTPAGEEWLINLEQAGNLSLAGDVDRCLDLARFAVLELAHNAWSDQLTVTVAGFGQELVRANPTRLTHTDDLVAAVTATGHELAAERDVADQVGVGVLGGRGRGIEGDTWMPHVLVVAPHWTDEPATTAALDTLLTDLDNSSGRTAVAVLLPGAAPRPGAGLSVTVHPDGTLVVPELGLVAAAQQLPVHYAAELAEYLATARETVGDMPMPAAAGDEGSAVFADIAGALLPEHTAPRTAAIQEPEPPADSPRPVTATSLFVPALEPATGSADATDTVTAVSLLPLPDDVYIATTATSAETLAALAPQVPAAVTVAVTAADPYLDQDLADWYDDTSIRPKVTLLGAVQIRAHGTEPEGQWAIATEAVAYFALHPRGVTGEVFADEFFPHKSYKPSDSYPKNTLSLARHWLGVDPISGERYLPYAKRADRTSAVSLYRLTGVLTDWDLFHRLRTRGEARGAAGLPDLQAALELVDGPPLRGIRARGGGWLHRDGVADADTMTWAIVDVADTVFNSLMQSGDVAAARRVAELARDTETPQDGPRMNLAATYDAEGRTPELLATVREICAHHGASVEEDLPPATYDTMLRKGWIDVSQAS